MFMKTKIKSVLNKVPDVTLIIIFTVLLFLAFNLTRWI